MRGGLGGTRAACASNGTTASCAVRSDGRAGRRTWAGRNAFYRDPGATLDNLHEAVTMLEDIARIARRVFGGAYPDVVDIEISLQDARRALRDREALLAKYLLYGASALAIAAFALARSRGSR